jgi:hypothetical protein
MSLDDLHLGTLKMQFLLLLMMTTIVINPIARISIT